MAVDPADRQLGYYVDAKGNTWQLSRADARKGGYIPEEMDQHPMTAELHRALDGGENVARQTGGETGDASPDLLQHDAERMRRTNTFMGNAVLGGAPSPGEGARDMRMLDEDREREEAAIQRTASPTDMGPSDAPAEDPARSDMDADAEKRAEPDVNKARRGGVNK